MAKQKSRKGKGQYATYVAESRLEKNRAAKRARHQKRHPNDEQSVKNAGNSVRKAPRGGVAPAKKHYWYDNAGQKHEMPDYTPERFKSGS